MPQGDTTMAVGRAEVELALERHRRELTGYCYRMLGSAFDARTRPRKPSSGRGATPTASRALLGPHVALPHRHQRVLRHDGREAATSSAHGAGPSSTAETQLGAPRPRPPGSCPCPTTGFSQVDGDPAELIAERESVRLAFIAALQHLPLASEQCWSCERSCGGRPTR